MCTDIIRAKRTQKCTERKEERRTQYGEYDENVYYSRRGSRDSRSIKRIYAVHALELSISKGMDPYCSLPALSTYMGHKGIESTEYYLRLTKQYFVDVLNYTQEQANTIFPEV